MILHLEKAVIITPQCGINMVITVSSIYSAHQKYCNMIIEDTLNLPTGTNYDLHTLQENSCLANELKEISMRDV